MEGHYFIKSLVMRKTIKCSGEKRKSSGGSKKILLVVCSSNAIYKDQLCIGRNRSISGKATIVVDLPLMTGNYC